MSRSWRRRLAIVAAAAALTPLGAQAAGPSFSIPSGLPAQPALYGAACPTATACFVVGGTDTATVLSSTDGGHTWTSTRVAGLGALYGISCFDATNCVAVGTTGGIGAAAIAITHDGQTWTAIGSLPSAPPLSSVSCVASSRCMAVGAVSNSAGWTAAALFSFDGGAIWAAAATPTHQGTPTALNAVRCPAVQTCLVAGGGAWVTTNFGGTWRDESPPDGCSATAQLCQPTYSDLSALDFTDASHGVVVGGEQCGGAGVTSCPSDFFSTTDGGVSWSTWPVSDRSLPFFDGVTCKGLVCFALSFGANASVLDSVDGVHWNSVVTFSGGVFNGIACAPGGAPCVVAGQVRSAGLLFVSNLGLPGIAHGGNGSTSGPVQHSGPGGAGGAPSAVVSSFGTSLPTPAAVASSVPALLLSALLVLVLVLFVVFPSQLFNRTYEENHARIREWSERHLPGARSRRERAETRALHGALALASAVLVGALLGTLLDPHAGFTARSGALFLGIVLSLLVWIGLSAAVNAAYRRARHRAIRWELRALPSGLVVAALCVVVSRAVDFQPGYLYGVIGGIAFAGALPRQDEGHVVGLTSGATLAVAVVAWLLWVPVATSAARPGAGFANALLANVLSALFVGGLAGVVLGLVPLRFLPGQKLAAWHWGVWTTMFALAMFGLVQIMLRPQSSAAHVASVPLWTTVGLFLGFGAASVAFWAYFRATAPDENAATQS